MRTLARPDTIYFYGQISWKPAIAEKIEKALAQLMDPNARNWIGRIEAYLACMDPFKANELRNRPWHELVALVKEEQSVPFLDGGEGELPALAIELAGRDFSVIPWSPRRGCNFQLQMSDQTIHGRLSSPSNLPNIYLEIGSAPFWTCVDWREFLENWSKWLKKITDGPSAWKVSRLDAAFHTQAIQPEDLHRDNFICKATTHKVVTKAYILEQLEAAIKRDQYARDNDMPAEEVGKLVEKLHVENETVFEDWFKGGLPQQISYGRRGWNYCRIYVKTREILHKPEKRALFTAIYKDHKYDPKKEVINVEFQLHRAWFAARELRDPVNDRVITIDTLEDLLTHYDTLCSYLIGCPDKKVQSDGKTKTVASDNKGWLRMIAHNRSRARECDTAKAWELIREATALLPHLRAADRHRARVRRNLSPFFADALRVGAAMDQLIGRPVKRCYGQKELIEQIAEIASGMACPFTDWEIQCRYDAARAKNQLHPEAESLTNEAHSLKSA